MNKLSDKARICARLYRQTPYGREIEGTAELLLQMAEKLEKYEELEAQGKLQELPCAVGTTVYAPYQFMGGGAWEIDAHKVRLEDLDRIGKSVFLTRAEAEMMIKKMEGFKL